MEALWPEGAAPTSHTSQLSGPQTMPDPLSHPLFPPGHLEPFIPTVSCISAFSRGYSHWAQPLHIAPGGRALGSHLAPWRSDGPRKTVSADCPAWAQPAPLLGAGTAPSRDGEGGHPGAGGLRLGRSSLEQGEEVASLGGSAWGRRACWVPLAKSEQVNDRRMKTLVLPTLPGINHCQ